MVQTMVSGMLIPPTIPAAVTCMLLLLQFSVTLAKERVYYLAAVEQLWDYAPKGGHTTNVAHNGEFFLKQSSDRIGSIYKKTVYKLFTDESFEEEKPMKSWQGLVGAIMRAEVGDTVYVKFYNKASKPYSVHPHGVLYDKYSEGAVYKGKDKNYGDAVPPGEKFEYTWEIDKASGPAQGDDNCIPWPFHSHGKDPEKDINTGLIGVLLVCKPEILDDMDERKDVKREFVVLLKVFNENHSWLTYENLQKCGEPEKCKKLLDNDDHDFLASNYMHALNGYMYSHGSPFSVCGGDTVVWHILGFGGQMDVHSFTVDGEMLTLGPDRVISAEVMPGTFVTVAMTATVPGKKLAFCGISSHFEEGMSAFLDVHDCGVQLAAQAKGKTRKFYLMIDEVLWDYAPTGMDMYSGTPLMGHDSEYSKSKYFESGSSRIGSQYKKLMYFGYTDSDFKHRLSRYDTDKHLGMLGPVLRVEENDILEVVLYNNASKPLSFFPYGLFPANPKKVDKGGLHNKAVYPKSRHTYVFTVPAGGDPNHVSPPCVTSMYQSAVDPVRDLHSGLVGALLICRTGSLDHEGNQKEGEERILYMSMVDENLSWLIDKNIKHLTIPSEVERHDKDFWESNQMHSVNGKTFGNLDGLHFCKWETVFWHVFSLGDESEVQGIHFHGLNFETEGRISDTVPVFPGKTITLETKLSKTGIYSIQSTNVDHFEAGMVAMYSVMDCSEHDVRKRSVNSSHPGNQHQHLVRDDIEDSQSLPEGEEDQTYYHPKSTTFPPNNEHSTGIANNFFTGINETQTETFLTPANENISLTSQHNASAADITFLNVIAGKNLNITSTETVTSENVRNTSGNYASDMVNQAKTANHSAIQTPEPLDDAGLVPTHLLRIQNDGEPKLEPYKAEVAAEKKKKKKKKGTPGIRKYFIAAQEIDWDYSPPWGDLGSFESSDRRKRSEDGSKVFKKAVFRQYTDSTFSKEVPRGKADKHLGILGPFIRAQEGETLVVTFKNFASKPYSMYAHMMAAGKEDEGASYKDSSSSDEDSKVLPGESFVYMWEVTVPEKQASPCFSSLYYSAHSYPKDMYSGLVGPLIICKKGVLNEQGVRGDVQKEFALLFSVFDENQSKYVWDNRHRMGGYLEFFQSSAYSSTKLYSINGYVHQHLPGLEMMKEDVVAWHVLTFGSSHDVHTVHFHGQPLLLEAGGPHVVDSVGMVPEMSKDLLMTAINPGEWMIHCDVSSHSKEGEMTTYTVKDHLDPEEIKAKPQATPEPLEKQLARIKEAAKAKAKEAAIQAALAKLQAAAEQKAAIQAAVKKAAAEAKANVQDNAQAKAKAAAEGAKLGAKAAKPEIKALIKKAEKKAKKAEKLAEAKLKAAAEAASEAKAGVDAKNNAGLKPIDPEKEESVSDGSYYAYYLNNDYSESEYENEGEEDEKSKDSKWDEQDSEYDEDYSYSEYSEDVDSSKGESSYYGTDDGSEDDSEDWVYHDSGGSDYASTEYDDSYDSQYSHYESYSEGADEYSDYHRDTDESHSDYSKSDSYSEHS